MHIHSTPDALTKLTQMGDVTLFEPAGDAPQAERREGAYQSRGLEDCISNVQTPRGAKPILKTMLTTACERNCYYCPFRAGRSSTKRVTIRPEDMAMAFDRLQRARKVDGLFLSSGIIRGGVTTQDKLIDTIEMVRGKYGYRGYVHLKIMPGSDYGQLYRAMQLADRVSINLEAPTQARLDALAPKKLFEVELLRILQLAAQIRREHPDERLARTVTQFVVGAVGDTDVELLSLTDGLHRQLGLQRAYFSAFHPVLDTPLENVQPTAGLREHRLYQSSFLLRDYGWEVEDLPFGAEGNLPTNIDPKLAWAESNLIHAPVELATADRARLLRVPGIGPRSADAILRARRSGRLRDLADLGKLGVANPRRAAPYILLHGHSPLAQQRLF
ncbi:MAG TPA: radical SAM protein [Candidatus Limnocylindrales bacterium]|nr:radical SAM protein [Candidatus Limnocylindrales bacterium]